jgi:hypothetical protein
MTPGVRLNLSSLVITDCRVNGGTIDVHSFPVTDQHAGSNYCGGGFCGWGGGYYERCSTNVDLHAINDSVSVPEAGGNPTWIDYQNWYMGGFIESDWHAAIVCIDCAAYGDVLGDNLFPGGFIGELTNNGSVFRRCFHAGLVEYIPWYETNVDPPELFGACGGFASQHDAPPHVATPTIEECFYDNTLAPIADQFAVGMSTANMKKRASYSDKWFGHWAIQEDISYPYLPVSLVDLAIFFASRCGCCGNAIWYQGTL